MDWVGMDFQEMMIMQQCQLGLFLPALDFTLYHQPIHMF